MKTKRLEIKPYEEKDQELFIELLINEEIKQTYVLPHFKNKIEFVEMFEKLKNYSLSEEHYERGIYLNNKLIGFVNDVDIIDDTIELGYVIHPKYKGNGYGTEMFKAVIEDLFSSGYREIMACAFEENIASFKVMEKCGLTKIGMSENVFYQGINRRCLYYTIDIDTFNKQEV